MKNNLINKLPKNSKNVNKKYYLLATSGFIIFVISFFLYRGFFSKADYFEPKTFFFVYAIFVCPAIAFFSANASKASSELRKILPRSTPNDVGVKTPLGANSKDPKTIEATHKYWFWQQIMAFFTGSTIAWMFGLFFVFLG